MKKVKQLWNKYNDLLGSTILHPQYFVKRGEYRCLQEIKKLAHGTFLDIGCGRQWYRGQIAPLVEKYYGLDHPKFSKHYESNYPIELKADVVEIPLPDKTVDIAMMNTVLELLPDQVKALKEIRRVLKNKGFLVVSTVENYPAHGFPQNYYRWTKYGLTELFRRNNFQVRKMISFGNFWETQVIFQNVYLMNAIKSLIFDKFFFILGIIVLLSLSPYMILSNIIACALGRCRATGDFAIGHIVVAVRK